MPLLWCRFDCDWQEDPFVAPLSGEERHVVGTVRVIAARQGDATWNPASGEPEHMRVGLRWLEPSYVAARANVPVETARRVMELMRADPGDGTEPRIILASDMRNFIVRNVASLNSKPIKDAERKRADRERKALEKIAASTAHPQAGDGTSADGARTGAERPTPGVVEGSKEVRKEVTTERGRVNPQVGLVVRREPGAYALLAAQHALLFGPVPEFLDCGKLRTLADIWLDAGYPAAHVACAYEAVGRARGGPNPPTDLVGAIRHLVEGTPVGAPMSWGEQTTGRAIARRDAGTDLRAKAAELAAEGK